MSDTAAPLTPSPESAPSAPVTTESITANVVERMEAEDSHATETPEKRIDTTDVTVTPEKPAPPPTAAELSAEAKFLLKQGHKLKKDDGRDTWLPAKTVEGMLARYVEEHKNTWTGERSTLERQAKEAQQHIEALRASVAGDELAFLRELADIDPRYKRFLEPQTAKPQTTIPADDPEPQPDYPLGDGRFTYSIEGLAKREAWVRRQIERDILGKMDERLKPWQERDQQEKQRIEHERMLGEVQQRTQSQLQEAQSWPLFGPLAADGSLTEFQQLVLDELKKDSDAAQAAGKRPTLTLEGAYIRVASPRFTEDETKKRERILQDMNKAPRSTAVTGARAEMTTPRGPRTIEEITRETLARMEGA